MYYREDVFVTLPVTLLRLHDEEANELAQVILPDGHMMEVHGSRIERKIHIDTEGEDLRGRVF